MSSTRSVSRRGKIFLSYQRADAAQAVDVRMALKAAGIDVWWDEELLAGTNWSDHIDRVLSEVDAVVVLWTEQAVLSHWVRYEAAVGRFERKLAHVRLDSCKIPDPFLSIQVGDLSKWDQREDHREFRKLVAAIRDLRRKGFYTRIGKWLTAAGLLFAVAPLGYLAAFATRDATGPVAIPVTAPGRPGPAAPQPVSPVAISFFDPVAARKIRKVVVPTFTSTVINTGGATDGDYLDSLADLFAGKFSALHPSRFQKIRADRPSDIKDAWKEMSPESWGAADAGTVSGRVLAYQDERPDIGRKAVVSVVISLFDSSGQEIWKVSSTLSESTPHPTGNPALAGIEAIELADRVFVEITQAVRARENEANG